MHFGFMGTSLDETITAQCHGGVMCLSYYDTFQGLFTSGLLICHKHYKLSLIIGDCVKC